MWDHMEMLDWRRGRPSVRASKPVRESRGIYCKASFRVNQLT